MIEAQQILEYIQRIAFPTKQAYVPAAKSTTNLKILRACFEISLRYRKSIVDLAAAYKFCNEPIFLSKKIIVVKIKILF